MGNYHKIGHICVCVCVCVYLSSSTLASTFFLESIFFHSHFIVYGPLSKPIENVWNRTKGLTSSGQSSHKYLKNNER